MRKFLLLFNLLFLLAFQLKAQTIKEFPSDDNEFIKTYSTFLKTCTRTECLELTKWFDVSFKSSKSYAYLPVVKKIANHLTTKKSSVYPAYVNLTVLLKLIDNTQLSADNISKNLEALDLILNQCTPGNIKKYNQYNDYLIDLFQYNTIFYSKAKSWKASTEFTTIVENDLPCYVFKNTDFIGTSENDTIIIKNASGKLYPLENKLVGTSGKILLTRAGFDATNNYVDFNDFAIDLNQSEINIDKANFTFKPYINEVLTGKYSDKLLLTKGQSQVYPKFVSEKDNIEFKTNGKEVKLIGGFMLEGTNTYTIGTEDKNAELTIFDVKNQPRIRVESKRINVKNFEQINAVDAVMHLAIEDYELVHPYLDFSYDSKTRNIKAFRDVSKPLAKQPFLSDYHKLFIYADQLKWNLDSIYIYFGMSSISDNIPAIFESYNYYHQGLENRYKAGNEAGPLLKIYRYYESTQDRNIDAISIAADISPSAPFIQTEQIFYKLVEDGYIGYNNSTKTIYLKDKLLNQTLASKDSIDYDNMKFASFKRYNNARLNTKTSELEIYGVEEIKISNKSQVKIIPNTDTVRFFENRNLIVSGKIIAGKVDFVGSPFDFDYDSYTFRMNKIDSLVLYIPEGDGKPNEHGIVNLVPSNSPVENITGTLYVAEANNKSGTKNNLKYPYFKTNDTANTFYDYGKYGDKYDREKFMFNIEPFEIDSLTVFASQDFSVKGNLNSGGIFERINTDLYFQEDKSLGTKITTTDKGLKLYGKNNRYFSTLELTKDGLTGKGTFEFGSAKLFADTAIFFLDSVSAEIDSLRILESSKFKFPQANADEVTMQWNVTNDSAVIKPLNKGKFELYNNTVNLDGTLIIQKDKLNGLGTLEWNKTQLKSNNINFFNRSFDAYNGQLNLSNEEGLSLLKSDDVNANFDFDKMIANIELNQNDTIPLESFKYVANPKFLIFDFNKNTIQLKATTALATFFLKSTDPAKEELTFETNKADLNLNDNTIYFGGIKELRVANSIIYPDKSELYIESDGSVRKLTNTNLTLNEKENYHKIKDAELNIESKYKFTGSGIYEYKSIDSLKQNVVIDYIDVNNTFKKEIYVQDGKKKVKKIVTDEDKIYAFAQTEIHEEDKFKLNKNIFYKGKFDLDSREKEISLDGFVKIVLKTVETDWIPFQQKLDPSKPEVSIDSILAHATNLISGILYDRFSSEIYTSVMQEKRSSEDAIIFSVRGNMSFDKANPNAIILGNNLAFESGTNRASAMKYDEITRKVNASGKIDIGLNLGSIKVTTVGDFEYNNDQKLVIDADLAVSMLLNANPASYIINSFISADSNFIYTNYRKNTRLQRTLLNLCDDELQGKQVTGTIFIKDSIYKPSSLNYNLILNGTKFFWDQDEASFKSVSAINLPFFGNQVVKRPYTAYVELGYGGMSDFVNILLKSKSGQWLFIRFKKGQMGVVSSVPDIFQYVVGLPDVERVVRDGKNIIFELLPADGLLKEDFEIKMEDFKERFKSQLEQK